MPSNTEQDPPLPWSAFLDELDQAISEPIELHCIGGFVVSLLYGLPRPTGDVDYVATAQPSVRESMPSVETTFYKPTSPEESHFCSYWMRLRRIPAAGRGHENFSGDSAVFRDVRSFQKALPYGDS
jgi:hypothetical protein